MIRSYCTELVESNGSHGVILSLGQWVGLANYERSRKCRVTKYWVTAKDWMGCFELPINISSNLEE
jgi:hypothetical protein